jgi:DNA-directed RNA polymerase specialized sigma24 family protein
MLLLVAVERMRYEEIAALLRVPVLTVIARLKRARDSMRGADMSSERDEQKRN